MTGNDDIPLYTWCERMKYLGTGEQRDRGLVCGGQFRRRPAGLRTQTDLFYDDM
jgi:hypothetical protein